MSHVDPFVLSYAGEAPRSKFSAVEHPEIGGSSRNGSPEGPFPRLLATSGPPESRFSLLVTTRVPRAGRHER
ncbi:hypothetical protein HYPDE_32698 [Hyphomicrobium denitrificans 1NES1]|uniref:Uncharacterized protein n=1 Tax=Hyphomicrobium denitrificans 1NES1 TaxID=670307 RepID=N0B7G5_9HYPH|nr:hypothetical protein HYPDE_32698 [Hyphomicrobium denitrificans 1NES1]